MPRAATPAQIPMALERPLGSVKTLVMIDSVAGMINAPPTPMKARVAIRASVDPARAEATDPVPKMIRPMVRVL